MVASRVTQVLARARGLASEVVGTLRQGDTTAAFTKGRIHSEDRRRRGGQSVDLRTRVLEIDVDGIEGGVRPQALGRVLFADESTWVIQEAKPIAPGGTLLAWRLTLTDAVDRDEE